MAEDTEAALEWLAYQKSLCPGCGQPKHETFDPAADEAYEVVVLQCHACAARDRKAYNRHAARDPDVPPTFGEFYAVTFDPSEAVSNGRT